MQITKTCTAELKAHNKRSGIHYDVIECLGTPPKGIIIIIIIKSHRGEHMGFSLYCIKLSGITHCIKSSMLTTNVGINSVHLMRLDETTTIENSPFMMTLIQFRYLPQRHFCKFLYSLLQHRGAQYYTNITSQYLKIFVHDTQYVSYVVIS